MNYGIVYFLLKFAAILIKFIVMIGVATAGIMAGKKLRDLKTSKNIKA